MALLESIEKNHRLLKRSIERISKALDANAAKPVGKTIGLNITPELRARLMKQVSVWEANSYRQVVQACVSLGLERMEELGRLREDKKEIPTTPPEPPEPSIRAEIKRFTMETKYDREDPVEEVQELLWADDEGDCDFPSPDEGEEALPRRPGILVDGES